MTEPTPEQEPTLEHGSGPPEDAPDAESLARDLAELTQEQERLAAKLSAADS